MNIDVGIHDPRGYHMMADDFVTPPGMYHNCNACVSVVAATTYEAMAALQENIVINGLCLAEADNVPRNFGYICQ